MADIQKMLEQKEKLQQKIKEEKKKEYEKFGRWFFNKFNVDRSADAKKIINSELLENTDSDYYQNNEKSSEQNNENISNNNNDFNQ